MRRRAVAARRGRGGRRARRRSSRPSGARTAPRTARRRARPRARRPIPVITGAGPDRAGRLPLEVPDQRERQAAGVLRASCPSTTTTRSSAGPARSRAPRRGLPRGPDGARARRAAVRADRRDRGDGAARRRARHGARRDARSSGSSRSCCSATSSRSTSPCCAASTRCTSRRSTTLKTPAPSASRSPTGAARLRLSGGHVRHRHLHPHRRVDRRRQAAHRRARRPAPVDQPREPLRRRRRGAARRRRRRSSTPCRAARAAQRAWAAVPAPGARPRDRRRSAGWSRPTRRRSPRLVTREIGKPYPESLGEVQEIIDTCDFFLGEGRRLYGQTVPSEMPDKQLFTFRMPVGVAAIITAGNFPGAVPSWYLVPAILCGNAVVWKPAEYCAAIGSAMAQIFHAGGVPGGRAQPRPRRRRGDVRRARARARGAARRQGRLHRLVRRRRARSARSAAATCSRRASSSAARTRWS